MGFKTLRTQKCTLRRKQPGWRRRRPTQPGTIRRRPPLPPASGPSTPLAKPCHLEREAEARLPRPPTLCPRRCRYRAIFQVWDARIPVLFSYFTRGIRDDFVFSFMLLMHVRLASGPRPAPGQAGPVRCAQHAHDPSSLHSFPAEILEKACFRRAVCSSSLRSEVGVAALLEALLSFDCAQ